MKDNFLENDINLSEFLKDVEIQIKENIID